MTILKDTMFIALGVAGAVLYQRYGDQVVSSMEEMLDSKIRMLKKIDDELENMQ